MVRNDFEIVDALKKIGIVPKEEDQIQQVQNKEIFFWKLDLERLVEFYRLNASEEFNRKVEEYVWFLEAGKRSYGKSFMNYNVEFEEYHANDYRLDIFATIDGKNNLKVMSEEEIEFFGEKLKERKKYGEMFDNYRLRNLFTMKKNNHDISNLAFEIKKDFKAVFEEVESDLKDRLINVFFEERFV